MNNEYIAPFLQAVTNVLDPLGIAPISQGPTRVKSGLNIDREITTVVGIVGDIQGNVAYSFATDTALQLVSVLCKAKTGNDLDDQGQSKISQFSNTVLENAVSQLEKIGVHLDVSPPSLIMGGKVSMAISAAQVIAVILKTPVGEIEVNIGLVE